MLAAYISSHVWHDLNIKCYLGKKKLIYTADSEYGNIFLVVFHEQRDTNGLTVENSELKLRLQTMEQQVHLQDGKSFSFQFFVFWAVYLV